MAVDWMQLVRLAMQGLGWVLMSRGVGDAALWEGLTGAALAIVAYLMSRHALTTAKAAVPPEVEERLQEMAAQLRQMQGVKG